MLKIVFREIKLFFYLDVMKLGSVVLIKSILNEFIIIILNFRKVNVFEWKKVELFLRV